MELVGRELELAAVAETVEAVRTGTSRVLGVLGEGGLGKTALLGALRERAASAGLLVLDGRGAEHESDVPYGVVVDAFDDHVATLHGRRIEALDPALGTVLPAVAAQLDEIPPSAQHFHQHRALRGLLEALARERPVALVLDDLHWADDASIQAVLHLLRRPPRAPTLIAFGLRPVDPAPRLLAAASAAPGARQLALQPLGHDAALRLLAGMPDATHRARIAREGAGNPLFLHELARVVAPPGGPLPATLMAAIRIELAALGPDARTLVAGAAVAGDPFDPELAAAAAGLPGAERGAAARRAGRGRPRPRRLRTRLLLPPSARAPGRLRQRARRRGASPPTSAPRRRSRRAARAGRRAPTTSSAARCRATSRRSRCSSRPRSTRRERRPAPRPIAMPRRCGSCPRTTRRAAPRCSRPRRWR